MIDYSGIPGWGDFGAVHTEVFQHMPPGATVVELGVAHGRGLAAMVAVAEKLELDARIVGVDHFLGTAGEDIALYYGEMSKEKTADRLAGFGVLPNMYEIVVSDTVAAADMFDSVDYVFLDADHSEEGTAKNIEAWWSKVAAGGYIGGHDWQFPGVSKAVLSFFDKPEIVGGECWLVRKASRV